MFLTTRYKGYYIHESHLDQNIYIVKVQTPDYKLYWVKTYRAAQLLITKLKKGLSNDTIKVL